MWSRAGVNSRWTAVMLLVTIAFGLTTCGPSGPPQKPNFSQKTQIVVQWLEDEKSGPSVAQVFAAEDRLESESADLYFVDGNDVGGGTMNIFIYADDARIGVVVAKLISLRDQLPSGMRIGVAEYKDAKRKDWTFRPVYPDGIKRFDITYDIKH